jgi:hypothetical protein
MDTTFPPIRGQAPNLQTPEFQFRGTFIPAGVIHLLKDKKITSTDLLLLILVDCYTRYGGHGCYAQNAYLGAQLRVTPLWVSESVTKLKRLGLLRAYDVDGKRHLVTVWSRICDNEQPFSEQPSTTVENHTPLSVRNHTISNTKNLKEELSTHIGKERNEPQQDGAGSMKPIFPELASIPGNPIDLQWAKRLRGILANAKVPLNGSQVAKWADQFRLLRQEVTDYTRIEDTLDWYESNVGGKYTPVVHCAKAFRAKFGKLEQAMLRHRQANPIIRDDAKVLARRLRRLGWTNGSDSQLEVTVQTSLDAFRQFRAKVDSARGITKYNRLLTGFVEHVWLKIKLRPADFVEQWLTDINHRYCDWRDWDGNLKAQAFTPTHKLFTARGQGWATNYANRSGLWDELLEVLNAG